MLMRMPGWKSTGMGGETAEALNLPMSTVAPSAQALKKACIITADETLPIPFSRTVSDHISPLVR